jgi:hypothetical protein
MRVLGQNHGALQTMSEEESSEVEELGSLDQCLDFGLFQMGLVELLGST